MAFNIGGALGGLGRGLVAAGTDYAERIERKKDREFQAQQSSLMAERQFRLQELRDKSAAARQEAGFRQQERMVGVQARAARETYEEQLAATLATENIAKEDKIRAIEASNLSDTRKEMLTLQVQTGLKFETAKGKPVSDEQWKAAVDDGMMVFEDLSGKEKQAASKRLKAEDEADLRMKYGREYAAKMFTGRDIGYPLEEPEVDKLTVDPKNVSAIVDKIKAGEYTLEGLKERLTDESYRLVEKAYRTPEPTPTPTPEVAPSAPAAGALGRPYLDIGYGAESPQAVRARDIPVVGRILSDIERQRQVLGQR